MADKEKMHTFRRRIDEKIVTTIKQMILVISLLFIAVPKILSQSDITVALGISGILHNMFIIGKYTLILLILHYFLFSIYSPIKLLRVRSNIIAFDDWFGKKLSKGLRMHSPEWKYKIDGKKIIIDLYPYGLIKDTADIGKQLTQFFKMNLLKYSESDFKARYIFGDSPKRFDGIATLEEDISSPKISYQPIPIYDDVTWNINSEALHILLLAPSGAGKSMFLNYLAGMVLKRQHHLYVIDAKGSQFGALFRHAGVKTATNTEEIIELLSGLVGEMEKRYSNYFAKSNVDIGANFATLKLKAHILIFDEILSALDYANKQQKAEITRLLSQIALKGRAAGIALVITAQKLNATDLPKSITEQCQTRIILGALVSEETFHQATNLYKKEVVTEYKGDVGKGYAITPKSDGLTYIETPIMPDKSRDCLNIMKELRDRGTPYNEGR